MSSQFWWQLMQVTIKKLIPKLKCLINSRLTSLMKYFTRRRQLLIFLITLRVGYYTNSFVLCHNTSATPFSVFLRLGGAVFTSPALHLNLASPPLDGVFSTDNMHTSTYSTCVRTAHSEPVIAASVEAANNSPTNVISTCTTRRSKKCKAKMLLYRRSLAMMKDQFHPRWVR